MKKATVVLALVLSAVMLSTIGSCAPKVKKIKIGLSLPTQREERWARDKTTMLAEGLKGGVEIKLQISDNDAAKQISQCENLLAQGIDVLILAPNDAKSASTIVEKAHKANIKVISYDRLVLNCDLDIYLSFDNVKVGEIQGEYITKLVPKGNYIVLSGAPTDNNAALFKQGAMKFIQPLVDKKDIKIVMEQGVKDWQPSEAMKLVEQSLTANNNKIDAILAPNDGTAGGAIQALAAQKLAGIIPITGQDAELAAAQRIVEGSQTMTVYKDTRMLGAKAIEIAIKIVKGEALDINNKVNNGKIDVPSILLTPLMVDKSNIDEILVKSGYLKAADVYKTNK